MTRWLHSVVWLLGKACLPDGIAEQAEYSRTTMVFLALSRPQCQGRQDEAAAEGTRGALYLCGLGSEASWAAPVTFLPASTFRPGPQSCSGSSDV